MTDIIDRLRNHVTYGYVPSAVRACMDDAAKEIERLRAGWLPIESAPKDGQWFLGWSESDGHHVARAGYSATWVSLCWCQSADGPEEINPTHWQPLPTPPGETA